MFSVILMRSTGGLEAVLTLPALVMALTMHRFLVIIVFFVLPARAFAQAESPAPTTTAPPATEPAAANAGVLSVVVSPVVSAKFTITVGVYLEKYYQLQLQNTS